MLNEARAVRQTGDTVTDDGCRLSYRSDGPPGAPAVLFSNSLGTNLEMWQTQALALAERYRVVRYDSRGHGASAVPPGPYTIERLGRDALTILDALAIERVHFCGLSQGGVVGQWLGANAAPRLRHLVLANTAAVMGPASLWNQRIAMVLDAGMESIADSVLERWFTPAFRASQPLSVARVREMIVRTSPAGYAACCAAIRDMDQRALLATIDVPALVIVGSADPATTPADGAAIAAAIPRARLVALAAAHLSNVEQASAFTSELLAFFDSAA